MTDEEYVAFLVALAAKHGIGARGADTVPFSGVERAQEIGRLLNDLSGAVRALKLASKNSDDTNVIGSLWKLLQPAPDIGAALDSIRDTAAPARKVRARSLMRRAVDAMEDERALEALDDAKEVVFAYLNRKVIPEEDLHVLRKAGFGDDEIEVMIRLAIHKAREIGSGTQSPSRIADEAVLAVESAVWPPPGTGVPEKKKRKLLNGIGKMLGAAVAGVGNVLLVTGAVVAPNPATGSAAIASCGLAISTMFAGIGDLRGE